MTGWQREWAAPRRTRYNSPGRRKQCRADRCARRRWARPRRACEDHARRWTGSRPRDLRRHPMRRCRARLCNTGRRGHRHRYRSAPKRRRAATTRPTPAGWTRADQRVGAACRDRHAPLQATPFIVAAGAMSPYLIGRASPLSLRLPQSSGTVEHGRHADISSLRRRIALQAPIHRGSERALSASARAGRLRCVAGARMRAGGGGEGRQRYSTRAGRKHVDGDPMELRIANSHGQTGTPAFAIGRAGPSGDCPGLAGCDGLFAERDCNGGSLCTASAAFPERLR